MVAGIQIQSLILSNQNLTLENRFVSNICIHVADGFPILSLTLVTEPLRVANREMGRNIFVWSILSESGGPCRSSSGLALDTRSLSDDKPDAVVLLASYAPDRSATSKSLSWLRRLDRMGVLLGCVDTGAHVFARAGLLERHPAAIHPEAIAGFNQQFPGSLFIDRLFDFSPPRFSSAGGVATLDMTLALIAHFTKERIARRVANILTYTPNVTDMPITALPGSIPHEVREAVTLIEARLSDPLAVSELAERLDIPVWRLNRLFQRHLHASPTTYYVSRRLARARDMLRNSTLPVSDIASACGYGNAEVFSRAYRTRFGCAPSHDRSL